MLIGALASKHVLMCGWGGCGSCMGSCDLLHGSGWLLIGTWLGLSLLHIEVIVGLCIGAWLFMCCCCSVTSEMKNCPNEVCITLFYYGLNSKA